MLKCVGGSAKRVDDTTLQLAGYVAGGAPPASDANVAIPIISGKWGLLGNRRGLDCTFAAAGHAERVWAAPRAPTPRITSSAVTTAYADACRQADAAAAAQPNGASGPNPPSRRVRGISAIDALNYWRKTGVAGHRIDAYAAVDFEDPAWVKFVIKAFGVAYTVLGLPSAVLAKGMTPRTAPPWNVMPQAGNALDLANDHAVVYVAYDDNGVTAISWGQEKPTSWAFHRSYCTEMYAVLRPSVGVVDGVDIARWKRDAAGVAPV